MIDKHLAELYGEDTRFLNQAVRRNRERFSESFMFQLTAAERDEVVTICDNLATLRFARTVPFAFTEHGVAMLSGVLRNERAIQVNIQIIQTFVRLRKMLLDHRELARRLNELEKKYDAQFKLVFDALIQLFAPPEKPKREIGFRVKERLVRYKAGREPSPCGMFYP